MSTDRDGRGRRAPGTAQGADVEPRRSLPPVGLRVLFAVLLTVAASMTLAVGGGLGLLLMGVDSATFEESLSAGDVAAFLAHTVAEVVLLLVALAAGLLMASAGALGVDRCGAVTALRVAGPVFLVIIVLQLPVVFDGVSVSAAQAATFTLFALSVGLAEEVAFRGVLFHVLGGRLAPGVSVAGSALLFGSLHAVAASPDRTVVANAVSVGLIVGVPFAVARLRGANTLVLGVLHGAIDLVVFVGVGGFELPIQSAATDAAQIVLSAAIAVAYWLYWRRWSQKHGAPAT